MAPTLTEKSAVKIQLRNDKGGWSPLSGIAGLTLRAIFTDLVGKEAVCEYRKGEKVWYFCGTDKLKAMMKKKGASIMFAEGVALLDSVNPGWLEEIPVTVEMEEIMKQLGQPEPCLAGFGEE